MKISFVSLSLMAFPARATPIDTVLYHHKLDEDGNSGPCRGSTASDKVDGRSKDGMTQEACEIECTIDVNCVAYSYAADSEGGLCLIYGPGQDGSCATHEADILDHCGSCNIDGKITQGTCGSCQIPNGQVIYASGSSYADNSGLCALQSGEWTDGRWTAGTWISPVNDWSGDSHLTVHVNYVTSVTGYDCYDKDVSDHLPKCNGYSYAYGDCQNMFEIKTWGEEPEDRTEADCTYGLPHCVFVPAPVPPASIFFAHSPISTTAGWNKPNIPFGDALNPDVPIALGACRSQGTGIAPPTQKDCFNDQCRASNGEFVGTQAGCRQACLDDPSGTCMGYSHADNSWCALHGPHAGIEEYSIHQVNYNGEMWKNIWNARERDVKFCMENVPNNPPGCRLADTAKPNARYMCQTLMTDHTRWEAYHGGGNDAMEVHLHIMTTGETIGFGDIELRKLVAELAFWKEDKTLLTKEITSEGGVDLKFVLGGIEQSFAEPMYRLLNGQLDNGDLNVIMEYVLPGDATVAGHTVMVMPASERSGDMDVGNGSLSFMQPLIGSIVLTFINAFFVL